MSDHDLRDVMLDVVAEVQETMRELMQEIMLPQMQDDLIQAWMSAPEPLKEKFREENPEGYKTLMELMQ